MKMIDLPSALRLRMIPNSSVASCGVSTAVGSSRIRIVGAAVERLQDLDPLLLADRDRRTTSALGSTASPNCSRELARPAAPRRARRGAARRGRLVAEHDVLGDGHHRDEHEVLVDHADPGSIASLAEAKETGLPSQADLARVRPGRGRRGCSSASTCRRRSRRAAHAPRRGAARSRRGRWRRCPGTPS